MASLVVVLLTWLHPAPSPDFLPLWFVGDRDAAAFPWAEQDRDALRSGGYFNDRGPRSEARLDGAALLHHFDVLQHSRDAVVVYLSGPAVYSGGQIYLLPADATPDNPATWLPLRQILRPARLPRPEQAARPRPHGPARPAGCRGPGGAEQVLTNDVAAAVPAELEAVEDPGRLVLCACGPGETALVSEDLGRSVFNFYLEEGLRGWADGYGPDGRHDGLITVRELAAFCQARVDRWARPTATSGRRRRCTATAPNSP